MFSSLSSTITSTYINLGLLRVIPCVCKFVVCYSMRVTCYSMRVYIFGFMLFQIIVFSCDMRGSRLRQKCQFTFGGDLKTPTNVMSVETG